MEVEKSGTVEELLNQQGPDGMTHRDNLDEIAFGFKATKKAAITRQRSKGRSSRDRDFYLAYEIFLDPTRRTTSEDVAEPIRQYLRSFGLDRIFRVNVFGGARPRVSIKLW